MHFVKFQRTLFFVEHLWWLLVFCLFFYPLRVWKFDSLYRFVYHFIISLVTGKIKYETNTLMNRASYDIWI